MRVQKTEVLRAAEVMWEPQCCVAPELGSMRALRGLTPIRGGHAAGPGAWNGDEQGAIRSHVTGYTVADFYPRGRGRPFNLRR